MDTSEFLAIELRIQGADFEAILARWEFGKHLLTKRKGSKLPNGLLATLTKQTQKSERELQFRMKLAEKFSDEGLLRSAAAEYEWSWHRITRELLIDAPGSRPRPAPSPVPSPGPITPKPMPAKEPGWLAGRLIVKAQTTLWDAVERTKDEPPPSDNARRETINLLDRIIRFATLLKDRLEGDEVALSFSDNELDEFRRDIA